MRKAATVLEGVVCSRRVGMPSAAKRRNTGTMLAARTLSSGTSPEVSMMLIGAVYRPS